MKYVVENIHTYIERYQKILFYVSLVLLVCFAILYAFFVNETVTNIVERKEVQTQITELNSELSELEFAYIKHQNSITLDYAHKIGFIEVEPTQYVVKGETGPTLSLRSLQE